MWGDRFRTGVQKPRTHKICDIRILILWTKIWPNLMILVSLESGDWDLSKFGKTKLVKGSKIWISARVKDFKCSIFAKFKIFHFDKIWPKIKIPPRWFIVTWRYHQICEIRFHQNWSQYGRTNVTRPTFTKLCRHQNPKSPKLALITKILKKILKTCSPGSADSCAGSTQNASDFQPRTHKICDIKNCFGIKFGDFGEITPSCVILSKLQFIGRSNVTLLRPMNCNFGIILIKLFKNWVSALFGAMGAAKRSKLLISFKMDPKSIKIIIFTKIRQNFTFFIQNRPYLHAGVHFVELGAPKFDIFDPKSTGFARGRAFCGLRGSKIWHF